MVFGRNFGSLACSLILLGCGGQRVELPSRGKPSMDAGASNAGSSNAGSSNAGSAGANNAGSAAANDAGASNAGATHSPHYVVFGRGDRYLDDLLWLDLNGDGEPVVLNRGLSDFIASPASPDGRFLVATSGNGVFLGEFTESGYVPLRELTGLLPRVNVLAPRGFEPRSRYAALAAPGSFTLHILDLRTAELTAKVTTSNTPSAGEWAPDGLLFRYVVDDRFQGSSHYVMDLATGGSAQPQALPSDIAGADFSPDGRRLFYAVLPSSGVYSFGVVEPPAAPHGIYQGEVVDPVPATLMERRFVAELDGQSILTVLPDATDRSRHVLRRLFADTAREPEDIGVARADPLFGRSASGKLVYFMSGEAGRYGLELLRGSERFPLVDPPSEHGVFASFAGEHLVYSIDGTEELHDVTLSGSAVLDRVFPENASYGYPCDDLPPFLDKWFFSHLSSSSSLAMLDLAVAGAGALRRVQGRDARSSFECPVCDAAGNGCAFVEHTSDRSIVFVMHFGAEGPSDPVPVFESDQFLMLMVAHP